MAAGDSLGVETSIDKVLLASSEQAVFDLVPSKRLGLEFDPSHFVRQYIDPISVAWQFKDRILAVHAKDTEIIQPVTYFGHIGAIEARQLILLAADAEIDA